ncbi:hypothetical protein A6U86_14570 [Rhizobium sp. AC27/96]|nr:hypothetical protein A6U86_14570 [Rhizobium sp. AC27/96]
MKYTFPDGGGRHGPCQNQMIVEIPSSGNRAEALFAELKTEPSLIWSRVFDPNLTDMVIKHQVHPK